MSVSLLNRGITIFDPDSRGGNGSLAVSWTDGTIVAAVGDSGLSKDDSNIGSVILTGTMDRLDAFLRGETTGTLIYTDATPGTPTVTLAATDEDGLVSILQFTVTAANYAAPVITVPGGTYTKTGLIANDLHGTGFHVSDADTSTGYATLVLHVVNASTPGTNDGTLSVTPGNSGVTVVSGNATNTVSLIGTIASLENLLADTGTGTLTFTPTTTGNHTFTLICTDSQGLVSSTGTKTIVVRTRPVITKPAGYFALTPTVAFDVHGLGYSYVDPDASGTQGCVFFSPITPITITAGTTGVTILSGVSLPFAAGGSTNGTGVVVVTGTLAAINKLLAGTDGGLIRLTKAGAGADTLDVSIQDNDGLLSASGSGTVSIVAATGTVWTNYGQATPPPTDVAISNFIVPIDLHNMPAAWWAAVASDGRDIRVTLSDNTQVPADLVPSTFSAANQTGIVNAKIANDTVAPAIRVWCGASNATALAHGATYGQDAVYDTSILKAWWPNGSGTDRTSNSNVLTMTGSPASFNGQMTAMYTAFTGTQYGKATAAVEDNIPEQFAAFVSPQSPGSDMTCVSSTHGTIRNLLGHNNNKVRGKTDIQSGTDNSASAPGNLAAGAWQLIAGTFYSTTLRQALRTSGVTVVFANSTGTSSGAAGGDAYIVGGIGTDVAGTVGVVADFSGLLGLTMIFKYASGDFAKFNAWMKNYANGYAQSTYWGTWTAGTGSVTGL